MKTAIVLGASSRLGEEAARQWEAAPISLPERLTRIRDVGTATNFEPMDVE